jgi:hypothetical protein
MSTNADPIADVLLVDRCIAGDNQAWGQLVQRYGPMIASTIYRCVCACPVPAYPVEHLIGGFWGELWDSAGRRLRAYDRTRPLAPFLRRLAKDFVYRSWREERQHWIGRVGLATPAPTDPWSVEDEQEERRHGIGRVPRGQQNPRDLSIADYELEVLLEDALPRLSPRLQRRLRYWLEASPDEPSHSFVPKNRWDEDSRLRRKLRAILYAD